MIKLKKSKKIFTTLALLQLLFILNVTIASAVETTAKSVAIKIVQKTSVVIPNVIKTIVIGVIILAVMISIFGFIQAWKNKTDKKLKRRISLSLLSFGLIIAIILNTGIYRYNVVIDQYFTPVKTDKELLSKVTLESEALTEQIVAEGTVLLDNKSNALPLDTSKESEKKINVFGQSSVSLVYGGSGSGSADESKNVNLQQGLENSGFKVNSELTDLYKKHAPKKVEANIFKLTGGDFSLSQPKTSDFSKELLTNATTFSDVALIVISRCGGEGGDLPTDMKAYTGSANQNYLELTNAEKAMIEMVKSMNFKKVVVVVNSSNAMELEFLKEKGIDAAIWIGGPGSTGANSVGKVLAGTVNPSGRLTDTYAYDATSSAAYYNSGDFKYLNTAKTSKNRTTGKDQTLYNNFVNFAEGIYVGYRYYETRYIDNATGKCDEGAYQKAVQYPFGYGLSYTNFKQKIEDYKTTNDKITVKVKVTNTGKVAGKDVVQLYYTAPYTVGGIEKSHVVLGAFAKTEIIEPGKSKTVTLEIAVEDMAAYDYQKQNAYVLDAGNYGIKLMNNSHDVIDFRDYKVATTIVYNKDNKRSSDKVQATNQFNDVKGDIKYVSRADWQGTLPMERTKNIVAAKTLVDAIADKPVKDNPDDKDIVIATHGLTLTDVVGLSYDDPKWKDLLEQITIEEMTNLIGFGGYSTQPIESIKKPGTSDIDGPAGLNGLVNGVAGVQFASETIVASTWNIEIAKKMGECMGNEAIAYGVSGLYSPAMNIHRTPFSGRNFEYYSEDGFLSGKLGAAVVQGSASKGVYSYIKHFALNDQETNRKNISVWSNEQAIREIYLKPFELSVKEGKATAVMSSFSRLGATWAGGSSALLKNVLRSEWGFQGVVITDYYNKTLMSVDQALRAGNSLMLSTTGESISKLTTNTNTGRQAMRQATHDILYTVANSNVMGLSANTTIPSWIIIMGSADFVVLALIAFGFFKVTQKKKEEKGRSIRK